ncbi:hypothetical protein [Amycolatopsis sp. NBC_01286]|uniref:hypothetical protein n=1 Tax=Amycolatopsis sp. NBC_01286 TaxID=2903560 RepID=UPI002E156983|nr:hypothetical protein OG570_29025 [Amycolatopsis sp. NBC_01286]
MPEGTTLVAAGNAEITASVIGDGGIGFGGRTYDTLADAAAAASGASPNSWTYWVADLANGHCSLSSLREASLGIRTES